MTNIQFTHKTYLLILLTNDHEVTYIKLITYIASVGATCMKEESMVYITMISNMSPMILVMLEENDRLIGDSNNGRT